MSRWQLFLQLKFLVVQRQQNTREKQFLVVIQVVIGFVEKKWILIFSKMIFNGGNKSLILSSHCKSQEKLETMLMQNFGWTNKEYYGIFDIGYCE